MRDTIIRQFEEESSVEDHSLGVASTLVPEAEVSETTGASVIEPLCCLLLLVGLELLLEATAADPESFPSAISNVPLLPRHF